MAKPAEDRVAGEFDPAGRLAGPTGYTGHGSLLSEMQDVAYTYHLTKEAGLQKTSKKGQKSN